MFARLYIKLHNDWTPMPQEFCPEKYWLFFVRNSLKIKIKRKSFSFILYIKDVGLKTIFKS